MGISIKDPETEAIIRKLAEKLDVGLTEAVKLAGQAELDRRSEEERERRIDEILAEASTIPVTDPRPIDELMADDEPR
ncbi:MAG: type II toxin-antitoxin system VapB family antitoxin [Hyphomonadaceae bacterium]|nr:type II toxin-antitoxin system VapB family antitoxin [Hyphomonadaceae bacterium]